MFLALKAHSRRNESSRIQMRRVCEANRMPEVPPEVQKKKKNKRKEKRYRGVLRAAIFLIEFTWIIRLKRKDKKSIPKEKKNKRYRVKRKTGRGRRMHWRIGAFAFLEIKGTLGGGGGGGLRFEDVKKKYMVVEIKRKKKREVITISKVLSNSRGSCLQKMLF